MKTTKIFATLCCVAALFAACEPQTNDPNNGQNNNNSNQNGEDASGSANGYDYVDLGLPSGLKWATCNVGADKPEGYGDYFAWGEVESKPICDWSTYKWCQGSSTTQTKYCTDSEYGVVDNKTVLDLADDAAHANWGGKWRMPTEAEWTELREKCTWTWTTIHGVPGYEVKSKVNSNSIFLPAAGLCGGTGLYLLGENGYYWSSSLESDSYPYCAWCVAFSLGGYDSDFDGRYCGNSIRPVLK